MVKINGKNETILFAFNSLFSKYNKVPNIIQNGIWKYSNWHWKYYIFLIMRPRTTKFERVVMMKMINDEELFLRYCWPTKGVYFYFQPGPLSEILTIANLRHAASRIWACAKPGFRLCWIKLCSSANQGVVKLPTKSRDLLTAWLRDKENTLYLDFYSTYACQTCQSANLGWGNLPNKSRDLLTSQLCDNWKTLYLHFHITYNPNTWEDSDSG